MAELYSADEILALSIQIERRDFICRKGEECLRKSFLPIMARREYERVLTASVGSCAVTLCFQDKSHGKNLEAIAASLKDAYRQRVKNWS